MADPHISSCSFSVVSFCIHINSSVHPHLFHLPHGFHISMWIDGKGGTLIFIDKRKGWNITWSVCDINHVTKRNSSKLFWHLRIYFNSFMAVNSFIDFKQSSRFTGIINRISNLTYDFFSIFYLFFYQFAAPDSFYILYNYRAFYHLAESGTYDIMFYFNIIFLINRIFFN